MNCAQCDEPFEHDGKGQRVYCSEKCRNRRNTEMSKLIEKYEERPRMPIETVREWLKKNTPKKQQEPYRFYKPRI